jgi:hypothetical protein
MSRRFDWPVFLRALGNRPDKSPQYKPRRSRTHRSFQNRAPLRRRPFISLPTCFVSLPVSERPFSAANYHPISHVQPKEISGGFLKLESLDFLMTPSPYMKVRPQDAQRPRGDSR